MNEHKHSSGKKGLSFSGNRETIAYYVSFSFSGFFLNSSDEL